MSSQPVIQTVHLYKRFGDITALDDVNITVARGEFVAIMGSSGSGKTTLMNILTCLDTPSEGQVLLNGTDAVPTADGQWAVPTGLPEHPSTQADAASVEDEIARAQSFADAGAGLVRDDARPSPLTSSGVVHAGQSAPSFTYFL